MLSKFIDGAKAALSKIGSKATKVNFMASTSWLRPKIQKNLFDYAKRMMNNAKTAKWWGRAARKVRLSGILDTNTAGTEIKAKGLTKWTEKGVKSFAYGGQSPKQLEREFHQKQIALTNLRKESETQRKRSGEVQKELSIIPLGIEGIPEVSDKINALSGNIDKLRKDVGHINSMHNAQVGTDKEARAEQAKANANIGEVVLQTSEGVTKVVLVGFEDIKNQNMGLHQETASNITSSIESKLDAMEENKKKEEEFKRKNDWRKKFLSNILLIMEWVLDFPTKLRNLIIKALLVASMAITAVFLANMAKLKAFMSGSMLDQLQFSVAKVLQGVAAIGKGVGYAIKSIGWLTSLLPGTEMSLMGKAIEWAGQDMINLYQKESDKLQPSATESMDRMMKDYNQNDVNEQVKTNIETSSAGLKGDDAKNFQVDPSSVSNVTIVGKDEKSKKFSNRDVSYKDPTSLSKNLGEDTKNTDIFSHLNIPDSASSVLFSPNKSEATPESMLSKDGKSSIKPGTHDPTVKPWIPASVTNTIGAIAADAMTYVSSIPTPTVTPYENIPENKSNDAKEFQQALVVMNENIGSVNANIKTAAELTINAVNAKVPQITKKINGWKQVSSNNKSDYN